MTIDMEFYNDAAKEVVATQRMTTEFPSVSMREYSTPHYDTEAYDEGMIQSVLEGLADLEAGRTIPDEVVSAEADAWVRSALERL
ncbi:MULTISPECIES: hypothetical protein [Pandoraea]|uniref:Uncharacterized protein n=1 Tax=Pandoraea norimbergensis TaxID=93219 RepID=A0ABM5WI11_9BURK|nr:MULTISPECIES: hypothetical protein [Pandoraea]ALS59950.1 hypothetical protein AT302_09445 [Pandoraea norimbergensis]